MFHRLIAALGICIAGLCLPGPAGATRAGLAPTEILALKVPTGLIKSLACVNPEVAQMLLLIGASSEGIPLPATGEGRAEKLLSCGAVMASIADPLWADISPMLRAIPANEGESSQVKWALQYQDDGRGVIHMKHRLLDDRQKEAKALYPDIDVAVELVRQGRARYWRALSWQAAN